jgi:UDP-glucose 4-epimerase
LGTRVLITGGAGFIGSHLAEAHLARGDSVHVLDDLSTGAIENLDTVRRNPRLHITLDSCTQDAVLAELVDRVDLVYHLAAAVGVRLIVESPVRTIETNVQGTERVLKHALKKRRPVFLASTSEVYGKAAKLPFSEEDDLVLGPSSKGRWSYAVSKLVDECLGLSYWRERGLPVVIGRLFNTVGPRQVGHYGMVVPRFVRQALDGEPLTVYGDGRQSRCFGYVLDVVPALMRLMRTKAARGEVFNLGGDEEISIGALARKVRDAVDPRLPIRLVPYAKAYGPGFEDMRRRVPDLRKIRRAIGYRPRHGIDRILGNIIAHARGAAS